MLKKKKSKEKEKEAFLEKSNNFPLFVTLFVT